MDDIKIIENAKEIKDLPRKNQWELVKSNTDTAESDIGNHSKDGKNSKTLAASNKCEDKSTQVIRKSKENDVPLDSSSNLSSNFNEKVQVKFKEGPDEVYYKDLTVQADQDTSDLHCDYVVSRVICDPICGRRDQFPQLGKYLPENKDIHHYFPHHKSAKIFGKSNHGEIDVSSDKNLPFGDVFHRFGNGQNNNQDVSEKSQNMEDMLNKRKIQTNSGNAAPIGRGIKRLKRMFGKEQPTPTELSIGNNNNGSRGNKQYHARSSIKHRVLQSKGRENCLYHYSPGISKPGQTNSHSTKMQENENISKFTIFDGFHPSRLININSLPPAECSCKYSTNGSGDREFQNKPSFAMNKPAELHDNQEDINIERTGYRISNPLPERIEVYYFDHGSSSYYRTTDHSPSLATDLMIEKTDQMSTKFWAGIFGFLHIFFAVLTAFYLQLFRFVLISSVRPLLIGTFQVSSDYFLKPFLATLFNAIIQPFFILLYNVATSFRDLCEPMARGIGFFLEEIANILRSIRLVEVRNSTRNGPFLNPYRNQAIEI